MVSKKFPYGGYKGQILRIDLSSMKTINEPLDPHLAEKFLGGNGLAAYYLYKEIPPKIDAYDKRNKIAIMTGPIAGTILPLCSRVGVFGKSPLTDMFFDSYAGGYFAPELKFAGYDGILIEGKAENPVYLWIDDGKVEFRFAEKLWGKGIYETQRLIKEELNDEEVQIAVIGPAGENLVRYAGVFFGVRAAGRGGLGAVLGSKNLKAIAVRGSSDITAYDHEGLIELSEKVIQQIMKNPVSGKTYYEFGTTPNVMAGNLAGVLGTRNWQTEVFPEAEKINGVAFKNILVKRNKACYNCPMMCGKIAEVNDGPYQGAVTEGPEYETLFSLGSLCGVSDLKAIALGDRLCDDYGMDTLSAGAAVAFAMELYERGILSLKDTGGIDLKFANAEAMLEMLKLISERKGLGDILAEGTRRAAQIIGKGSEDYAVHIKGLEPAGHSARAHKGLGMGYAVATRGGSHHDPRPKAERSGEVDRVTTEGKGQYVAIINNMTAATDSFIICHMAENFLGFFDITEVHSRAIKLVTGLNFGVDGIRTLGERVWNLERAFNCREGKRREDDTLPKRFLTEPIPEGPSAGLYITEEQLEKMKDDYYAFRGWDLQTGIPTKEKLKELGLEFTIKDLWD
jgi:aldehyde:ferredoxin oxidoreductase